MEELTSTENKISFARQAYNDAVTTYNTSREQFPDNVISSTFNFKTAALLEAVEKAEERKAPKVSFT
jgi:LemA protein